MFQHPLSGASGAINGLPLGVPRPPLIAARGRVLAVVSTPGGSTIDFYDAARVTDVSAALGPGLAKLRYLSSFVVVDGARMVAINTVAMLPGYGSLLVVAGDAHDSTRASPLLFFVDTRVRPARTLVISTLPRTTSPSRAHAAVLLAYDLCAMATSGSSAPMRSDVAVDTADNIAVEVLPSLVFRAEMLRVPYMQLIPHRCSVPGVVAVCVGGETTVRFFDVARARRRYVTPSWNGPSPYLPGASDATVGSCSLPSSDGTVVCAAVASDGQLLTVATTRRSILVFALRGGGYCNGPHGPPALPLDGTLVARFACESDVTALAVLPVPPVLGRDAEARRPPPRSRLSGYAIASGHANGFLNIWWTADGDVIDAPRSSSSRRRGGGRGCNGVASHSGGAGHSTYSPRRQRAPRRVERDGEGGIPHATAATDDSPRDGPLTERLVYRRVGLGFTTHRLRSRDGSTHPEVTGVRNSGSGHSRGMRSTRLAAGAAAAADDDNDEDDDDPGLCAGVVSLRHPVASYPPLGAVQGPITFLSDGIVTAVPVAERESSHERLATVLLVGAHGSAGLRPYVFLHLDDGRGPSEGVRGPHRRPFGWSLALSDSNVPRNSSEAAARAAARAVGSATNTWHSPHHATLTYDMEGRRVSVPAPVSYTTLAPPPAPRFTCPSYGECLRTHAVGARSRDVTSGGDGASTTLQTGFVPLGIAVVASAGSAHEQFLRQRLHVQANRATEDANDCFTVTRDSVARLLARQSSTVGATSCSQSALWPPGTAAAVPLPPDAAAVSTRRPLGSAVAVACAAAGPIRGALLPALATLWATSAPCSTGGGEAGRHDRPPPLAAFAAPRTVAYALSERGVLVVGLDYAPAIESHGRPQAAAAAALELLQPGGLRRVLQSSAATATSDLGGGRDIDGTHSARGEHVTAREPPPARGWYPHDTAAAEAAAAATVAAVNDSRSLHEGGAPPSSSSSTGTAYETKEGSCCCAGVTAQCTCADGASCDGCEGRLPRQGECGGFNECRHLRQRLCSCGERATHDCSSCITHARSRAGRCCASAHNPCGAPLTRGAQRRTTASQTSTQTATIAVKDGLPSSLLAAVTQETADSQKTRRTRGEPGVSHRAPHESPPWTNVWHPGALSRSDAAAASRAAARQRYTPRHLRARSAEGRATHGVASAGARDARNVRTTGSTSSGTPDASVSALRVHSDVDVEEAAKHSGEHGHRLPSAQSHHPLERAPAPSAPVEAAIECTFTTGCGHAEYTQEAGYAPPPALALPTPALDGRCSSDISNGSSGAGATGAHAPAAQLVDTAAPSQRSETGAEGGESEESPSCPRPPQPAAASAAGWFATRRMSGGRSSPSARSGSMTGGSSDIIALRVQLEELARTIAALTARTAAAELATQSAVLLP